MRNLASNPILSKAHGFQKRELLTNRNNLLFAKTQNKNRDIQNVQIKQSIKSKNYK